MPNTINFLVKFEVKSHNAMWPEFKDCKKYSGGKGGIGAERHAKEEGEIQLRL